jgi:hypothetical protein
MSKDRAYRQASPVVNCGFAIGGRGPDRILKTSRREDVYTSLRLSARLRSRWSVDVYNVTNNASIVSLRTTYGPTWLKPTKLLDSLLIEVGGRIEF